MSDSNLVPRVLRLFGQWLVARRDSGDIEFYHRRISAVKQWKPLRNSQSKNLIFFDVPKFSPGAHPVTKKPEDSGYEIGLTHNLNVYRGGSNICIFYGLCKAQTNLQTIPLTFNHQKLNRFEGFAHGEN